MCASQWSVGENVTPSRVKVVAVATCFPSTVTYVVVVVGFTCKLVARQYTLLMFRDSSVIVRSLLVDDVHCILHTTGSNHSRVRDRFPHSPIMDVLPVGSREWKKPCH